MNGTKRNQPSLPPPPPRPGSAVSPPVSRPAPRPIWPADWRDGPRASRRALQAVVVGGAAAGALWGYGVASVGAAIWLGVVAAAVAVVPNRRDPVRVIAVGVALVFAGFLALRSSLWLIPLNVLAAFGLIAFGAVLPPDRAVLRRPALVIARFFGLLRLGQAVLYVARPVAGVFERSDTGRLRAVGNGVLIAIPVVATIGALLAAGDAVFSAVLEHFALADGLGSTALYVAGGAATTTVLMLATSRTWETPGATDRPLGSLEATVVAGALAVLYAVFAITQAFATFGGADRVLETAGLTRAEYAREGFFQLLWAAGLTLAILLVLDRVRQRDGGAAPFRASAVVSSLLTVVVVAVSVDRLLAYVDDFGWTMLRLYTVLFAAWVGLLFVALALRFAGLGVMQRWYPVFVAITGLVGLLGLNVLNPEAYVARENLANPDHADADYLADLSPDATPAILDGIGVLSSADQVALLEEICGDGDAPFFGNIGRGRAFDAARSSC